MWYTCLIKWGDSVQENILLVEDDRFLLQGLRELLERSNYCVTTADCVAGAWEKLRGTVFDLLILDVSLPDGDGVCLCQRLRQEGVGAPILFLTARDEEYDVVRGLDAGGNDYVTKPFRVQELLSRIRVLLRKGSGENLRFGGLELDRQRLTASWQGQALNLTPTEYRILAALVQQRGVVPRGLLLDILWDSDGRFVDDNTLSVHISRLREKIGSGHIRTVRGVGYQWQD